MWLPCAAAPSMSAMVPSPAGRQELRGGSEPPPVQPVPRTSQITARAFGWFRPTARNPPLVEVRTAI